MKSGSIFQAPVSQVYFFMQISDRNALNLLCNYRNKLHDSHIDYCMKLLKINTRLTDSRLNTAFLIYILVKPWKVPQHRTNYPPYK